MKISTTRTVASSARCSVDIYPLSSKPLKRVVAGLLDGIVPARMPCVTSGKTTQGLNKPSCQSVSIDCLVGIIGARRVEPAGGRKEPGDGALIDPEERLSGAGQRHHLIVVIVVGLAPRSGGEEAVARAKSSTS